MAKRNFQGGPWAGRRDEVPVLVPSQRVAVYADPPADLVCADEQVIELLGHYERAERSSGGAYYYDWREA